MGHFTSHLDRRGRISSLRYKILKAHKFVRKMLVEIPNFFCRASLHNAKETVCPVLLQRLRSSLQGNGFHSVYSHTPILPRRNTCRTKDHYNSCNELPSYSGKAINMLGSQRARSRTRHSEAGLPRNHYPPHRPDVTLRFQSIHLFPHCMKNSELHRAQSGYRRKEV
jgi:hypothetical protein